MYNSRSIAKLVLAMSVFAAVLTAIPASAQDAPAITAFDEAFAKVSDYTVNLREFETKKESPAQNRTYEYWFKRPELVKTLIVSGPGSGSGGVWNGGGQISGHQGGVLSFVHMKVAVNDPRATTLRGYTIPQGLIQNQVDRFRTISGTLTQHPGPVLDGTPTDELDLDIKDPASNGNATRAIMYLSARTHFPVRQIQYEGSKIVYYEWFTDLKTNVGLRESDFPF